VILAIHVQDQLVLVVAGGGGGISSGSSLQPSSLGLFSMPSDQLGSKLPMKMAIQPAKSIKVNYSLLQSLLVSLLSSSFGSFNGSAAVAEEDSVVDLVADMVQVIEDFNF